MRYLLLVFVVIGMFSALRGAPQQGIAHALQRGPVYLAHGGQYLRAPEGTNAAYAFSASKRHRWIESDAHENADGSQVVSHDATATYVTTSSANYSSLSDAQVAALTVDSGTWFGVADPNARVMLHRDWLRQYRGHNILVTETKDNNGPAVVAEFAAANIPTTHGMLASFTVGDLTSAAGYWTQLLGTTTSVLATAQSNSISSVAYRIDAADALFTAAKAAGVPVFAYTVHRRYERDRLLGLNVDGIYCDDIEYTQADAPLATTDNFAAQKWMPGMFAAIAAAGRSRPTLAERGRFFAPDYWGWSETADTRSFVLQGWAGPIKGDTAADDFTIDLKVTFDSAVDPARWASVFIADEAYADGRFTDDIDVSIDGYHFLMRKNGTVEIFKRTGVTFSSIASQTGTAITDGTEVRFRVIVSPTDVKIARIDGGGSEAYSASVADATYRGGYFHLGKRGCACKFRDVTVS